MFKKEFEEYLKNNGHISEENDPCIFKGTYGFGGRNVCLISDINCPYINDEIFKMLKSKKQILEGFVECRGCNRYLEDRLK